MDRTHIVTFDNQRGHRLVGILHEPPAHGSPNVAVILLSPGVKNRIAPHRLYNKIADRLVGLGLWVLRFDFEGLGDSDGAVSEPRMADLYRSIQLGRYVQDTHCSMDWMRSQFGIQRFVLGGLCGGAITGVLAAANRKDVVGIFGLGIPVMLDGSQSDNVAQMTAGQRDSLRQRYIGKLLTPGAWMRLLTLKTDYRLLARVVFGALTRNKSTQPSKQTAEAAPSEVIVPSNANPLFPAALEGTLANNCPVLLMFSESDRLYWEFREKFAEAHGALLERHVGLIDIQILKEANHVLTFLAWQQDMIDRTVAWLGRRRLAAPSVPTVHISNGRGALASRRLLG